jgi:hypothetical protein
MYEIIIAAIVVILLIIAVSYRYFYRTPEPAPALVAEPVAKVPSITYTNVVATSPETADSPTIPGTTIISTADGDLIQYGDETPISANEDEHFQPYMSVLTNDIYRSDAAFDPDLSKDEHEIYGNYI